MKDVDTVHKFIDELGKEPSKKIIRPLYLALGSITIIFLLVTTLVIPFVMRNTDGFDSDIGLQSNMVADGVGVDLDNTSFFIYPEPEPYTIFQAPQLNWTKFWQVFKNHASWKLEAKHPVSGEWIDSTDLLTIKRNYTSDNNCKIGLQFTTPDNGYSLDWRFTLGIDYKVKQYVNKSGEHEYTLTYESFNNSFSVVFNWSDMLQYSGLIFSHGVKNIDGSDYFWFRVRRNNVPPDFFVDIDPNYTVYSGAFVQADMPSQRKMARQSNGTLWVGIENSWNVYIAHSEDEGISWSTQEIQCIGTTGNPSIAVDSNDVVHYVFTNASTGQNIYYSNSSDWSIITEIIDYVDQDLFYPAIAVDSQDNLHVVCEWDDTDSEVIYTRSMDNGGSWEPDVNLTNEVSAFDDTWVPSIAVDSNDVIHVVFMCEDHNGGFDDILHIESDDYGATWTDWEADPVVQKASVNLQFPCLAIDDNDVLHVVYNDGTNLKLRHTFNDSTGWMSYDGDDLNNHIGGYYGTISIIDDDRLYAFSDSGNEIGMAYNDTEWVGEFTLTPAWSVAYPNSLMAQWPVIDGAKTNRPKTGYAITFACGTSNITFNASDDLTWETAVEEGEEWQQIQDWNITLVNDTFSWNSIQDWNITLSNGTFSWQQISDWNITLVNDTFSWNSIQDWNITLSNTSIDEWQSISDWNITLVNDTFSWNSIQDWNITLSNSSVDEWTQIQDWNITLSNTSLNFNSINDWNITLSNTTLDWESINDWNLTLTNTSVIGWTEINNWNLTLSNTTNFQQINNWNITLSNSSTPDAVITITNVYPADNSHSIPLQPTLYLTINNSDGDTMNITWYYGTLGNENTEFGTNNNIGNSTNDKFNYNFSSRGTIYYWRVMANDGTSWINETYSFTTEGYDANIQSDNNRNIGIIGAFGILGLIFVLIKRRRDKNVR